MRPTDEIQTPRSQVVDGGKNEGDTLFAWASRHLGVKLRTPMSDVWGPDRLASVSNQPVRPAGMSLAMWQRLRAEASFAHGRRNSITRILMHRHGQGVWTDDGPVYLELITPFIVEACELSGRSAYVEVLAWARRHLPAHVRNHGMVAVVELVRSTLERRDRAEAAQAGSNQPYLLWLPDMNELSQGLRPTRAEVALLGLSGWRAIDPPSAEERRSADAERKRQERLAKGVRPQSTRNKTKDLEMQAAAEGISLSTLKRRLRRAKADPNLSGPYMLSHGADTFGSQPVPANDDEPVTVRKALRA